MLAHHVRIGFVGCVQIPGEVHCADGGFHRDDLSTRFLKDLSAAILVTAFGHRNCRSIGFKDKINLELRYCV